MQIARIEGKAVSTVKHASYAGWRLLIAQPVNLAGRPDGNPLLVIDSMGANAGDLVMLTTDGKGARELVGTELTPARITVLGIIDDAERTLVEV